MDAFPYRVSVIVPVHNAGMHLEGCIRSLLRQTITQRHLQIILVDDGSTDESGQICDRYARKYQNIVAIHQENQGVSNARNAGIRAAKGKYMMFLDADDTLSANAAKTAAEWFEEHGEDADLVAFNMQVFASGRVGAPHYRFEILTREGIYDLNDVRYMYALQTNMNVAVKNRGDDNLLFDGRLHYHEDEEYVLRNLLGRMKLGYCKDVTYYYVKRSGSTIDLKNYAYYHFDPTMTMWEEYFSRYASGVPLYIQALFVNDVLWKSRSDRLWPYHYEGEEYTRAKNRILTLLEAVDDSVILAHPRIDPYEANYFISLKRDKQIVVEALAEELRVSNHGETVSAESSVEIGIHWLRFSDGKMRMTGYLISPALIYLEKPRLFLCQSARQEECADVPLFESARSYFRGKGKLGRMWGFEVALDYREIDTLYFQVEIEGVRYPSRFFFSREAIFNSENRCYMFCRDGRMFSNEEGGGEIRIALASTARRAYAYVKQMLALMSLGKSKQCLARLLASIRLPKDREIWLYSDSMTTKRDNAYYQFKNDFYKNDGVERYYVTHRGIEYDEDMFDENQKGYLVRFRSLKHRILFFNAAKIIAAYLEFGNYMPMNDNTYNACRDLCTHPERIYLGHGVLQIHLPWKYAYEIIHADRQVISTALERDVLKRLYGFRDENLIPCGMPRYDYVDRRKEPKRKILYAPSWRSYLIGYQDGTWKETPDAFAKSTYYEKTRELLQSPELERLLEKYDFELDFKLHPIFETYGRLYRQEHARIRMARSGLDESEYQVFITDFSSYLYDFIYLKRAVIYFVPDYVEFKAGLHLYREMCVPFENAFGEFVRTVPQAIEALEAILERGGRPLPRYAEKTEGVFFYHDNQQCRRLYESLVERK